VSHATLIKLDRRQPPSPLYFPDRSEDLAVQQPALDDERPPPLSFPSKETRTVCYTLVDDELSFIYFDFHEPFVPAVTTFLAPPPQVIIQSPEELFYVSSEHHEPFVPAVIAFTAPAPSFLIHSSEELFFATLPLEVDEPYFPVATSFPRPTPHYTVIFDEPLDLTGLAYFLLDEPEPRIYMPVILPVLRLPLWEESDLPIIAGSIFGEDEPFTSPRSTLQPPNRYVDLVIAITLDPDFGGYHNGIDEGFVLDQPSIEW